LSSGHAFNYYLLSISTSSALASNMPGMANAVEQLAPLRTQLFLPNGSAFNVLFQICRPLSDELRAMLQQAAVYSFGQW
jgi:hypothetical protein